MIMVMGYYISVLVGTNFKNMRLNFETLTEVCLLFIVAVVLIGGWFPGEDATCMMLLLNLLVVAGMNRGLVVGR